MNTFITFQINIDYSLGSRWINVRNTDSTLHLLLIFHKKQVRLMLASDVSRIME